MHKTKGLVKWIIVHLRHITTQWCHTGVISMQQYQTRSWKKYVHIHHTNMNLTQLKCVLRYCTNCPCIDITGQESDRHNSNTSTSICFNIYHLIKTKIYTRKELVMMETSIADFHKSFYIPAIKKLAFHLPHV